MIHLKALKLAAIAASVLIAPVATGQIQLAHAQSFSCANAQIPSEMAICNFETLLIKDETVAELLAAKLVSASRGTGIQTVSRDHSVWLKRRNACQTDIECLEARYDERIEKLVGREL